jgi:hypothetical protein
MLRCVLFIILLAIDFTSSVYLFITLMITEVLMVFFVQLEFNRQFYQNIADKASSLVQTTNGESTSN